MKEAFKNIIEFTDVQAIFYIGKKSETVHISEDFQNEFESGNLPKIEELESIIKNIGNLNEAELIFSEKRIYIRRIEDCHIIIVLGFITPTPMLQLNCDISIPELSKQQNKPKGFSRFFKR